MKRIANLIFCIFLSLFIIGASILLTVGFKELYYFDIENLNIATNNNLSVEEVKQNYDYMIDYNLGKISGEFNLPTIKSSLNGKIHFEEVKEIIQNVLRILLVSLIISVVGIYINLKNKNINFLNLTSKLILILPGVVSIPMIVNFDKTFILFHEIMFDNDYWIFDPEKDPVINLLPQEFFLHAGIMIVVLILLSSLIFRLLYKYLINKNNVYSINRNI
ncbi:MAG: TIGR01906 family membrane protein [Romboutsia sp.]|nr:TIGR01906 family membrane protein [Romboutsia sp.]